MIDWITNIVPHYPASFTRDRRLWLSKLDSLAFLKCGQASYWLLRDYKSYQSKQTHMASSFLPNALIWASYSLMFYVAV